MTKANQDIQERATEYALRAIKLFGHLQGTKNGAAWIIAKQYLRAATSIGANMVEAQSGESRADFIHKCAIAQKEARESHYWLTILRKSEIVSAAKLAPLLQETNEIIAIITSIIVNTKKTL